MKYLLLLLSLNAWADCKRVPASEIKQAIEKAAEKHGLKSCRMWAIVEVETSGGRNVCTRKNTNGTTDVGPFQINSIHQDSTCIDLNLKTIQGNALCAARILKTAKKKKSIDPLWIARYHSKRPSLKAKYYSKLKPFLKECM